MAKHYRTETDCLNCGSTVEGKFCSNCGQENLVPKESFKHIMTHFITDYLHIDEKLFGSLKPLLFKPGFLTNEYNDGRRNKYVNPFRLYIFISIAYFLLYFNISNREINETLNTMDTEQEIAKAEEDSIQKVKQKLAQLDSNKTAEDSSKFNINKNELSFNFDGSTFQKEDSTEALYLAHQDSLPEDKKDNFFRRFINIKSYRADALKEDLNDKIMEGFMHNIPKMMFMMLPVFALMLHLFFRKSKKYYVEHFFHSVHIHAFLFLLLGIFILVDMFIPVAYQDWTNIPILLAIALYLYFSTMKVYHENGAITIFKLIVISAFYLVFILIGVIINAGISFLML